MAGDRTRVRQLLDAAQAALDDASVAFDEEFPIGPPVPTPGPVIKVAVGDDVQAALVQARTDGSTLLLAPGEHRVNLRVTADPTARRVLITSDTTNLPPVGTRITRDYLPGLAQLRSANSIDPVLRYDCGATGVDLRGLAT